MGKFWCKGAKQEEKITDVQWLFFSYCEHGQITSPLKPKCWPLNQQQR